MEEEKAAAYYEELTRKGEGAARFKQGLGFSTNSDSSFPSKTATSSSSLFSNFVRASSPSKLEKQAQLESIHSKLTKKAPSPPRSDRRRRSRDVDDRRRRSPSRERQGSSRRRRSREREEEEEYRRERHRKERRRRSRSRSSSRDDRDRERGRGDRRREGNEDSRRRRPSPHGDRDRDRARDRKGSPRHKSSKRSTSGGAVDYSQMIEGYSEMTPAERVKAKMKLQLSETAAKDTGMGMGSGWERFDFNKDAPLDDDDDEVEVADDDASIVKDIGKSFRFSAVEARREEEVKAAHDEAMFGVSKASPVLKTESAEQKNTKDDSEDQFSGALISDKVLSMQQGSWRDRASKFRNNVPN